ncbi:MAG TPA: dTMP kinase [bacterium]|nr:dTMP kinase [bacterium]HNT66008.1 dTMP kinase [bacterium]HOX86059.1 dTMP kinase [bacterium]HPG45727.1 dTMP kinase [bacterium]HPM97494.1 dTMP kinase [bacterium]
MTLQDHPESALFLTFEGIDFCGKSTQIARFYQRLLTLVPDALMLRDPGSNTLSEKIRRILLDPKQTGLHAWTELLLYEAARAQMVQEQILPALQQKQLVICDRFYDSTTAYQGYGRRLDLQKVETANRLGSCGLKPDLTFYIDLEPEIALLRKGKSHRVLDRLEQEGLEFQHRVRNGYLQIAGQEADRFLLIDGNRSIEEIQATIWQLFEPIWWSRRS